jgi:hypothetical protein
MAAANEALASIAETAHIGSRSDKLELELELEPLPDAARKD